MTAPVTVYTTEDGTDVRVEQGTKSQSPHDFIVRYQELGKRQRTPQHIHLIVDLFAKQAGNAVLTADFVSYLLSTMRALSPAASFPPSLQVFDPTDVDRFRRLGQFGDYPADFQMVVTELIMIQERTNYPDGNVNTRLYESFQRGDDIFTVVGRATYRGR